jgi:hypothetical protein
MSRVGTGLTAATLPLVIATAFAQAGKVVPAAVAGAVAGVIVLLTFAAYLPGLRRVPIVGAPRLEATFTANASPSLAVAIPGDREPHSVLIRAAIESKSRSDVEPALLNFAVPIGHGLRACDAWGEPNADGKRMPPTQEPESFDYWMVDDLRFTAKNTRLFHFRMKVREAGEYEIKLRIRSKDMYDELVVPGRIRVTVSDDLGLRDRLGVVIDEGEALRDAHEDVFSAGEDSMRQQAAVFLLRALDALRKDDAPQSLYDRLTNVDPNWNGPQTGNPFQRAQVAAWVRELYEIRDHVPVLDPDRLRA